MAMKAKHPRKTSSQAKRANECYVEGVRLERSQIADFSIFPFSVPAIQHLERIQLHPAVTFFVGENGSGKSTLLEAIAVKYGFNAEGGSKNFSFSTRPSHSLLDENICLERSFRRAKDGYFLRAESFYNLSTEIENIGVPLSAYGGKSLHECSHGEAFLALITQRLKGNGFYVFDEPEAALSPQRQLSVLAHIHQLVERQSQFIIATHSPILLAYPYAQIYEFSATGIRPIAYEDTEHFTITREFLNRRERMLEMLFAKNDSQLPLE